MHKFFKNQLAKEAFYKKKCQKGLEELAGILENIENNQSEMQSLRKQKEESLRRLKLAMSRFEN